MKLNNTVIEIEDQTISTLLEQKNINTIGIAIAVNNKVVSRKDWTSFIVTNEDNVMIITAAYGG